MEVLLAGYNLDSDVIQEFAAEHPERQDLTPETVAAAYARISRNPRPVNELRSIARGEVEKARASNRNIVFEMGHSSIAEHAVFNLDILKVSRLLAWTLPSTAWVALSSLAICLRLIPLPWYWKADVLEIKESLPELPTSGTACEPVCRQTRLPQYLRL